MANPIYMKASKTFYGTDGYIVAGQEFFTTSEALANQYYKDGVAVFADGSEPELSNEDLKVQAREAFEGSTSQPNQTEFKTSELERNVTSMANPVNLKIAVSGVNPEDLNIEVVRDEEVQAETRYVEGNQEQARNNQAGNQAQYPAEKQQLQPSQNQSASPQYQQQNQQPSQQQNVPIQPKPVEQSAANQQSSQQSNQQSSQQEQQLEQREAELIRQLQEVQKQQEQLKQQGNQAQSQQSSGQQESGSSFEIRHVGGGWYDLPNGERVQGKDNAEARLREIESAYQHQQGQVQQAGQENENGFRPNPNYVQQANTGAVRPEDGQSLNDAQVQTYGALSGGQPQGGLSASNENNSMQGTGYDSGSTVSGNQAQAQPRNSEGEFVSQGNSNQGMTSQASGAQGNTTGGSGQAGNTRGGATSSGGNNTGGAGQANNTGGNSGGGNTGQGSGGNTGQ